MNHHNELVVKFSEGFDWGLLRRELYDRLLHLGVYLKYVTVVTTKSIKHGTKIERLRMFVNGTI